MAGRKCPRCNQLTFFINERNGECKSCGYKMQVPANEGKGGKGKRCPNSKEAIKLAGLDWKVEQKNIYTDATKELKERELSSYSEYLAQYAEKEKQPDDMVIEIGTVGK